MSSQVLRASKVCLADPGLTKDFKVDNFFSLQATMDSDSSDGYVKFKAVGTK